MHNRLLTLDKHSGQEAGSGGGVSAEQGIGDDLGQGGASGVLHRVKIEKGLSFEILVRRSQLDHR